MLEVAADGRVVDVVVVGAGISGLVTAHRLKCAGWQVQVLDANAQPGGVIGSIAHQGCLYERGPNSALDTTPLIGELVDALGLRAQWRQASDSSNKRYVLRGGVLMALPTSPGAFFSTPLFSTSAKLALLREPFVPRCPAGAEESIAAFVRRRLGSEFLDYAIDPFVAGIYAGDPEQISVPAAFPKLHALEQRWGSLIKGQILGARERRKLKEEAKNTAKSFSFAGGMQVLTDALAAAVGPVALGTRVTRLERDAQGVFTLHAETAGQPTRWRARAVVLATPTDTAANLLREHVGDAADALDAIAYAPVATVATAYPRAGIAHALDGFGCLVPRCEGRKVLGILFSSSMFEGRAGPGTALLTTFVGGLRQPQLPGLPEDEIGALVQAEHQALLGASQAPIFQHVTRWPRAIPQYTLGHLGRVARAEAAGQVLPGLFFCANWKGGVSVGDCIKNGHLGADAVTAHLRTRG
ncbi:MAG: protoporphyrinogen oxidase [Betaproteobacteria bacterium]|nr:protoporphyrinogen oxidase [Betaproteobacteria bacterium]